MRKTPPAIEVEPEDPLEEFITKLTNPMTLLVFRVLKEKHDDVTEEEIAEKLGISKNMTRKLLYKLHDLNIVIYRRVRNKETGWYHYYWRINWESLPLVLINRKRQVLKKLKEKLEVESSTQGTYRCPKCGSEYGFDEAFENEFRCPKCGVELAYIETGKYKPILEEYIMKLEEELERESKKIQSS